MKENGWETRFLLQGFGGGKLKAMHGTLGDHHPPYLTNQVGRFSARAEDASPCDVQGPLGCPCAGCCQESNWAPSCELLALGCLSPRPPKTFPEDWGALIIQLEVSVDIFRLTCFLNAEPPDDLSWLRVFLQPTGWSRNTCDLPLSYIPPSRAAS